MFRNCCKGHEKMSKLIPIANLNFYKFEHDDIVYLEDGLCPCLTTNCGGGINIMVKMKDVEKAFLSQKMIDCFTKEKVGGYPRKERFMFSVNRDNVISLAIETNEGNRPQSTFIKYKIEQQLESGEYLVRETESKKEYVVDSYNKQLTDPNISGTIVTGIPKNQGSMIMQVSNEPKVIAGIGDKKSNKGTQWYEQDRIYESKIATAVATSGHPNYAVPIKNATKDGYLMAEDGDGIDVSSRMETHRGTVQKGMRQTLKTSPDVGVLEMNGEQYAIRKLTPKECMRLMGFDDEDYEKQAFRKETNDIKIEIVGGKICNVKLRDAQGKPKLINSENYALCTTKDLQEQVETSIEWIKSLLTQGRGNNKNASVVIDLLEEMGHLDYVTSTIKCTTSTKILCGLMEELDQHRTAIIEQEQREKENIELSTHNILEENYPLTNVFIILTALEQIIESRIFGSIPLKVSIQEFTKSYESCGNNTEKGILTFNLKTESTYTRVSSSMVYKQAGNGIVVNVLEAIFRELYE